MAEKEVVVRVNLGDLGISLADLEKRIGASGGADAADAPYYCGTNKSKEA